MVYAVPLIIFMDNVSGNISKQWNKHFVMYMSNANLWHEMFDWEFFVWFITLSHASPMELMHHPHWEFTWDSWDQEEVMLVLYALFLGEDNPMQAKECSQGGLNCNYYCQTCHTGGLKEYKELEAGYCSLFKVEGAPGIPCTLGGTLGEIKNQFKMAVLSGVSMKIQLSVLSVGVCDSLSLSILNMVVEMGKNRVLQESQIKAMLEKELTELLSGKDLDDMLNPLLDMEGINTHMDTPTEILHTILLGIVKYFWGQTMHLMEKVKLLHLFQSHLDSIEHDALNAPNLDPDYICHYEGTLIGKHFKSLAQVMPFIIHDLVPQTVIDGWTTIRELVVLLWHMKIKDLEAYLV
ncbi:hypothetical protein F5141DRAFT_1191045 [Pisolithus sp. B1]|nr:hypothetical protein F5141DRAFT_1191045 [Pisolithus sp. B1]